MSFVNLLFSALILLLGIYYAVSSFFVQVFTGEHAATLACACFLFVIVLGVWRDKPTSKHDKRMEEMMIELIRRQGTLPPQEQPVDYSRPDWKDRKLKNP